MPGQQLLHATRPGGQVPNSHFILVHCLLEQRCSVGALGAASLGSSAYTAGVVQNALCQVVPCTGTLNVLLPGYT